MSDGKEEAMIAGLTAEQHDALCDGLRALPETMPPRAVWERIREQGEAEGLLVEQKPAVNRQWFMGAGLAAAVAAIAIVVPALMSNAPTVDTGQVVPPLETVDEQSLPARLNVLRAESSQLEGDLAALPGEPRVLRAGTAATIEDIKVRIAAIDYQLSDPEVQLTPEEQEIFWRERVRLMKLLVSLRVAQTQRAAF